MITKIRMFSITNAWLWIIYLSFACCSTYELTRFQQTSWRGRKSRKGVCIIIFPLISRHSSPSTRILLSMQCFQPPASPWQREIRLKTPVEGGFGSPFSLPIAWTHHLFERNGWSVYAKRIICSLQTHHLFIADAWSVADGHTICSRRLPMLCCIQASSAWDAHLMHLEMGISYCSRCASHAMDDYWMRCVRLIVR